MGETTIISKVELREFNQKEKEKIETILTEQGEIMMFKNSNEVEREASQNYLKYNSQKSTETIDKKDKIDENDCSRIEELTKEFRLDNNSVNGTVVDKSNELKDFLEKKPCILHAKMVERDIGKCYQNRTQKFADTNVAKRVFKIGGCYQSIIWKVPRIPI
ncbi:7384_t:CDS:2 [Gigaspora margarita]|uniref:7384_t:CDS:1 n=1 Tax=Gigaspora margarita TaxID=4874 RepID=A0ABN7VBK7_GIGMA|nr:7384_t:CDS:2 [Gigaspora margarita]